AGRVRSPRPAAVYPPPEYTEPAPKLRVRASPTVADTAGESLEGASEGYRFVARAVVIASKPSGWTFSVYAREVADDDWFPETRAPQFHLHVGAHPLARGATFSGALAHDATLSFQTINAKLAIQGYPSRVSYFLVLDTWDVAPYTGKSVEAGRASGRLYFYVQPHSCDGCFKGAQIAGAFKDARVRYFTAPP
ncbi:MAG TPA: hypothetical protein PLR99_31420, partial [Polyangiaceae bacterium]|nr:hypothetical protein [Polyangiaceae bacterium]